MKNSKYFQLIIFSILIFASCIKDNYPDLGYNIFDDDEATLFNFDNVSFTPNGVFAKDIRVSFSSVYDDLPEKQKEKIDSYIVFRNGIVSSHPSITQTFFGNLNIDIGTTVCYELAFSLTDGSISKKSEKLCVLVE